MLGYGVGQSSPVAFRRELSGKDRRLRRRTTDRRSSPEIQVVALGLVLKATKRVRPKVHRE
jgi:hypothetical protein